MVPTKPPGFLTNFARVVGGIEAKSTQHAVALYRRIVRAEIFPTGLTAEAAKTADDTYRMTRTEEIMPCH